MARHADFLASPYVILDPALRWFPAPTGEALRGASMDGLMRPLTGNAHSGGAMSSICRTVPRDEPWHARPPATLAVLLDGEWFSDQTPRHRRTFCRANDDVRAGAAVVSSERCVAPLSCVA